MIHIETVKLSEHKDYDRMGTLLQFCKKDNDLRDILINAI